MLRKNAKIKKDLFLFWEKKSYILGIFPEFRAEIGHFRKLKGNFCQIFQKNTAEPVQREINQFSAANLFVPHWFI